MAADDRDPKFERALVRELRSGSAHESCPDAETLAAYHERSLSLEEMAHCKQHISGCAACQEALSLLEVTEKELAEDWQQRGIPMLEATAHQPVAARKAVAKRDASAVVASAANTAPVVMAPRRGRKLTKWAIPLGALAASVLIGIGIYQQWALLSPRSRNVQVSVNQPQAAPRSSKNEAQSYTQAPVERDARQAQQAQLDGEASRKENEGLPKERMVPKLASPPVSTDALRKDTGDTKKRAAGNLVAGATGGAGAAAVPAPPPAPSSPAKTIAPPAITESVEVAPAAPTVPSSQSASTGFGNGSGAGVGGRLEDQKQTTANKEKSSVQQQSADLSTNAMMMSKQGVSSQAIQVLAESPGVIVTPDSKAWWRLTAAGTVELTSNSGKKWNSVNTGVSTQLTAGSAPSAKVCWIAGKAGALVLTTDRGRHWKQLTTPIPGDLGGVHASDAKHATIWDAANRQSFETSDAGETWKPVAIE